MSRMPKKKASFLWGSFTHFFAGKKPKAKMGSESPIFRPQETMVPKLSPKLRDKSL